MGEWIQNVQLLLKTWKIWAHSDHIPKSSHGPGLRSSCLPYPGHVCSGSPGFLRGGISSFCFNILSTSWPMKTFAFENPVLTLGSGLLGGGGDLLTSSQTNAPASCMHHHLNKQINDENLPLHQFMGDKTVQREKLPRNLYYDDKY